MATILKLNPVPLQVGHLKILTEAGSPFLDGGDVSVLDVILAAIVLALPSSEASQITRWYFRPIIWLWSFACRKCVWPLESAQVRKHLNDAMDLPRIKKVGGSDKAVTSPLHRRLYVMLRQELHMEHSEALAFPVREAIDTWASLAEQRGALELFSDEDMAYFEWHKEQEAAFLAAQGTN